MFANSAHFERFGGEVLDIEDCPRRVHAGIAGQDAGCYLCSFSGLDDALHGRELKRSIVSPRELGRYFANVFNEKCLFGDFVDGAEAKVEVLWYVYCQL